MFYLESLLLAVVALLALVAEVVRKVIQKLVLNIFFETFLAGAADFSQSRVRLLCHPFYREQTCVL